MKTRAQQAWVEHQGRIHGEQIARRSVSTRIEMGLDPSTNVNNLDCKKGYQYGYGRK
jgi:hypothetical protein